MLLLLLGLLPLLLRLLLRTHLRLLPRRTRLRGPLLLLLLLLRRLLAWWVVPWRWDPPSAAL